MPAKRKNEAVWMDAHSRWQIKVQVNGKRKTFYSSTPGRKGKIDAERKADMWLDDGANDDPKLETVWAAFLAETKATTGTANYTNHESLGRNWLMQPKLKIKRISSVTMQDWQNVLTAMHKAGKSKKYMQDARGSMTALYNYARKNRIQMERPEFLTIPKSAPVGERTILQPDKLKTLFAVDWTTHYGRQMPAFFIHAWRFLVLTGLRRGELCGLRAEDVAGQVLNMHRAVNRFSETTNGKTDNASRRIVMTTHMLAVLDAQRDMLKQAGIISPWVFPDESGERLEGSHLYDKWATYRTQHNMACSLHELRHTMVSIVKSDVPEALLKSVVGHSKAMDTQGIYGHEVDGDAERAATLIDDVFSRILD